MLKRKQVITLGSIVVISFLVGTAFNVVAMDSQSGNPWVRVWEAIEGLRDQINELKEKPVPRLVSFVQPNETVEDEGVWKDAATFTWTPEDNINNAILSVNYYFEYKHEPTDGYVYYRILLYGDDPAVFLSNYTFSIGWHEKGYRWSNVASLPVGGGSWQWLPNQSTYTIKFRVRCQQEYPAAYVRNINFILTVADGTSASNT